MINALKREFKEEIQKLNEQICSMKGDTNSSQLSDINQENLRMRESVEQFRTKCAKLEAENEKLKEDKQHLLKSFEIFFQGKEVLILKLGKIC